MGPSAISGTQSLGQRGHAAGPVPALLPPGAADAAEVRMDAVPTLGAHTEAILGELGLGAEAITSLRAARAI